MRPQKSAGRFDDLAQLQVAIQRSVLEDDSAARSHVVGTRQASVAKRLEIYREAYYLRLAEALGTTYPALYAFLGEDQFRSLARRYIDAHPSRHYSVRYFGHRLAAFLTRREPYRSTPVLADLARWEWAAADVFDAQDAAAMEADALTHIAPDRWPLLRFQFHTAIRLVSSRWNVAEIWSTLTHEQTPPDPVQSRHRGRWAIWRADLEVYFAPMSLREERALGAALHGEPLAEICAWAPDTGKEADATLWAARILRQWVERGWIVRLARAATPQEIACAAGRARERAV